MKYISTRGTVKELNFLDVIEKGLANDGGLFIPKHIPKLTEDVTQKLKYSSYEEHLFNIAKLFIGDEIPNADLQDMITEAYSNFRHPSRSPLSQLDDNHWLLELYKGPTYSFKDYALQFVGKLFDYSLKKRNKKLLIVGATSGDTGSAGIEAIKPCENAAIVMLHPHERVSDIQRKQMTTIDAKNVLNIAIEGDFDDCQNMVKTLFADSEFNQSYNISAVNSINWARIMSQIAYYVYACSSLKDSNFAFSVPTGNFGNVLAGFYAKAMGMPIHKLIFATNKNDILYRCFNSGDLYTETTSMSLAPSMDIQISSNFERMMYYLHGEDSQILSKKMQEFKETRATKLESDAYDKLKQTFASYRFDDEHIIKIIKDVYQQADMIIDPHTACAYGASKLWQQENIDFKGSVVSISTAHPAKFNDAIKAALGFDITLPDNLAKLNSMKEKCLKLPNNIDKVKDAINSWYSSEYL